MSTTTDLSEFGYRELKMAAELLTAYVAGGKGAGLGDGVRVMSNTNSGNVFLIDDDCNVAMMHGEALEQWHTCPECGEEGFEEDFDGFHQIKDGVLVHSFCSQCGATVPTDDAGLCPACVARDEAYEASLEVE